MIRGFLLIHGVFIATMTYLLHCVRSKRYVRARHIFLFFSVERWHKRLGALMRTGATAGITDRTYLCSSWRSPR